MISEEKMQSSLHCFQTCIYNKENVAILNITNFIQQKPKSQEKTFNVLESLLKLTNIKPEGKEEHRVHGSIVSSRVARVAAENSITLK